MNSTDQALLVWTTIDDKKKADDLARQLVASRLAACVHILAQGDSYYVWDGELQKEAEFTLLIKTRATLYSRLETRLKELHPYDTPEILATKVAEGESDYMQWLLQSTRKIDNI